MLKRKHFLHRTPTHSVSSDHSQTPEPPSKSNSVTIKDDSGKSRDVTMGRIAVDGLVCNAVTTVNYAKGTYGEELGLLDCMGALADQVKEVRKGNLKSSEMLLTCQAVALNAIFTELARRSALNMGEYLDVSERYMRLALKAQNQCRMTLETLAMIKNPPMLFAKQANINQGNGNQQVNNGTPVASSHAGKTINQQNELLTEGINNETLDTRRTRKAGRTNQELAAVETINRRKNT